MKNRWFIAAAALVLVVAGFAGLPAFAQQTGAIDGLVVDSNNAPLPGVSIEIKSSALQGTRTTVTDANGRYKFPVVPPGTYTVTSSLSGFTKAEKTNVRVSLGGTATINVTMAVSVKEEVVVTGEAPVIDTTKSTLGAATSIDTIQKLPLGRNFTSIATTVAGTGTSAGGGITVYGATGLENQYIIDGVNTTGIKIGDQGKTMNQEFIQEVEVKTGGYEAEYSRALGGVINVVTKSGGNEFHGDVFGYYDAKSLAASDKNVDAKAAVGVGAFDTPKRLDIGADLGGYFMKDRIWFFGAYDRINLDQDANVGIGRTYTSTGAYTTQFQAQSQETRNNLWSAKLTFRLGESHSLAVSGFGDPGKFTGNVFGVTGPDQARNGSTSYGGSDYTAKYDGIFGTQFLAQFQYGHHEESNVQTPISSALALNDVRGGVRTYQAGSGAPRWTDEKYKRDAFKLAGTGFFGSHEVKAGIDYEQIKSNFTEQYGGGMFVTNFLSNAGAYSYSSSRYYAQVIAGGPNCTGKYDATGHLVTGNFGVPGPANTNGIKSIYDCAGYAVAANVNNPPNTTNTGFFVQDSWKVMPNLTLNIGVRYDDQKLKDADGNTPIHLSGEWSPRLGIVWDFMNNGKSKVYASYGRYYTVIPQDIQTRALGNEYTVFAYHYNQNARYPYDESAGYAYTQGGSIIQDGLKGMYQDEIIGGLEYEVFKNWSFGIKGIYKSLGRTIEDRCDVTDSRVNLTSYIPYGSLASCALVNYGDATSPLNSIPDPTNPACKAADGTFTAPCESTKIRRYYRGMELTATHRFANNFYMLASYVYSSLKGNYDGNEKQSTGQQDPNINADFDYVDMIPNNFGSLSLNRTHQFKVSGSYSFPFGLVVGANFRYGTGAPYAIRGYARPGYTSELYLTAGRGEVGTLPSQYEMDLHLEYNLRLGGVTITPIVDVFNLLNRQSVTTWSGVFNTLSDGSNKGLDNRYNKPDPSFGASRRNNAAACASNPSLTNWACSTNQNFGKDTAWLDPTRVRLGARVSF